VPIGRATRWGGVIVGAGVVALIAGMVLHMDLNPDEAQHLHMAWRVGAGDIPYVDFWEHHAPLLAYLLAPLTVWLADIPAVYFVARALMALILLGSLALVYAITRRLGSRTALAAVLLLGVQYRFLQSAIHVRPDGAALLAWLATVYAMVRWREGSRRWLSVAGLGLGLVATLTPKAAYVGLGAVVIVVLASWTPSRGFRGSGPTLLGFVTSCAVPIGVLLVWLATTGGLRALPAFVEHVLLLNLRFPDFVKHPPFGTESAGFAVLALTGIAIALWRHGRDLVWHPVHGPVLIPVVIVTAILVMPTTPAVYRHTWLPVLAGASVYAAVALVAAIEHLRSRGGRAIVAVAVVAGILVPLAVTGERALLQNPRTTQRLERIRATLAYACPGETVFDSSPWQVFRSSAFRFFDLGRGLRIWLTTGVMSPAVLVEDLRHARAPVGTLSWRLVQIDPTLTAFIERHYVPSGRPDVWLAGARIPVPGGSGTADVDLLVPGRYRVSLTPDLNVTVNGEAIEHPSADLGAGLQRISWAGPAGSIELVIAPCAERRS
jgi:hypothetical protein